ncbi:hypothetical protein [Methanosarcina sp. UBA5]|uniref:hypothetical protein n=1 Tax=Methanosarcina sp. UBA5 TaxID=1915593 RepID=UPI0025D3A144|nr:hypothetical protein [Methanosarcina sp. UBA5]
MKTNIKIQTHVSEEMMKRITKARGIASTSAWVRAVIEQHFNNNPDGRFDQEGQHD